ncbi:MAG: OmpA family protein [Desulfamplus sp.]|nr:OmpA family protein [Desulfamplus sp.]
MNAKLLSFDISKDDMSILKQHTKVELVKASEDDTEKILGEFLSNIDTFAHTTIEESSIKQRQFLDQWQKQLKESHLKKYSSDQQLDIIEKKVFDITQEKIAAEDHARELFQIKEEMEASFKKIEAEKAVVENALAEFEKNAAKDLLYKESVIHQLNSRLDEYVKETELQNSENKSLKKSIEILKSTNAEIESQNRILSAEIKIDKKELEFTEKRFLKEISGLNEKINELHKKSDSAASEAEVLRKEKATAEIVHVQSRKALENAENLNSALKNELKDREKEIRTIQEKAFQHDSSQAKKIEALEGKLYQNDAQYAQKIHDLEHKLSDAMSLVDVLERDKKELEEFAQRVEKENRDLESKNSDIQSRILAVESEKSSIIAEIETLKGRALINSEALDSKINTLEEKLSDSLQKYKDAQKQIESHIVKLNGKQKHIEEITLKLNEEQKATEELRSKLGGEQKTLGELRSKLNGKQKHIEEITLQLNEEQKHVEELTSKLAEAQKQKELFIANKLNNTLQAKRDSYLDKSPGWLSRFVLVILPLVIILILSFMLLNRYYFPMVQSDLDMKVTTLTSQLENKSRYIESVTKEQQQLTAKLDGLTRQVEVFQDKIGDNLMRIESKQVSMIENQTNRSLPDNKIPLTSKSLSTYQIKESIYFESGIKVNQAGVLRIKALAEQYNGNPHVFIRIEGHTDDKKFRFPMLHQYGNNIQLSIARAAEVSRLLVHYGMDTSQISIVGLGDTQPLVPNTNEENREKNRRVEIKITAIDPAGRKLE